MKKLNLYAFFFAATTFFSGAFAQSDPLKIGYLVDASGPMQGIFKTGLDGFQLYLDSVNAAGGVNGRKVEVMVRDVQIDPARAVSNANELVDNGALAIVGLSLTSTHMPVYNAMERAKVPVITGFPANLGVVLPPKPRDLVYGVGLAFEITGWVGGELARKVDPAGKSFVCTVFESPGGIIACDAAMAAAKEAGFTQVDKVLFPVALRDFRPVAEKIVAIKPDVVLTIFGRGRTLNFFPTIADAGYKGSILSMEAGTGDDELRAAAKSSPGMKIFSYARYASGGQSQGPQVTALNEAAKNAGIPEVLAFHSGGWVLGMTLVDALKRCANPCNAVKLNAALGNTKVDTGGLTGEPIVFKQNDHYGPSAYNLYRYDASVDKIVPTGDIVRASSTPKFVSK
jgi:branched-chain amino acid transport system substrate-binding protein